MGLPGPALYLSGRFFHASLSALVWVLLFGDASRIRSPKVSLVIPVSPLSIIPTSTVQAASSEFSQRVASTVPTSCGLAALASASSALVSARACFSSSICCRAASYCVSSSVILFLPSKAVLMGHFPSFFHTNTACLQELE